MPITSSVSDLKPNDLIMLDPYFRHFGMIHIIKPMAVNASDINEFLQAIKNCPEFTDVIKATLERKVNEVLKAKNTVSARKTLEAEKAALDTLVSLGMHHSAAKSPTPKPKTNKGRNRIDTESKEEAMRFLGGKEFTSRSARSTRSRVRGIKY